MNADTGMKTEEPRPSLFKRIVEFVLTVAAIAGILFAAWYVSDLIKSSEPKAEREAATRRSAALVETIVAESDQHTPVLRVLGSVRPARQITLSPRVSGEIVTVDERFQPGARVKAGTFLLRVDPADYEQSVRMREGELGQVEAELAIEEGQQRVAELEFKLLGDDIDPANKSLVLREPQIASLKAKSKTSKAALEQARLDLERTTIKAPFDAQIIERFVELGSQVSAGARLARLVGTEEYWIEATVPLGKLRWIRFPENDQDGSPAKIFQRAIWPDDESRTGTVKRLIGEVDDSTRLARVLVAVKNPLGGEGRPPLILGNVVEVEIEVSPIKDVVRLETAYLRRNNTVWIMDKGALRIAPVEVVFVDGSHAYIRDGLKNGDRIITTDLATVSPGLPVREAAAVKPKKAGFEAGKR